MELVLNDRVRETTSVVGTGAVNLLGYVSGYQAFSVIGNGNTCYYTISDQVGLNWEVGIGTYTSSGNTLARTKVLSSSNADALVSFTTGTKDVFITYPAETSVSGGGGGTYPTTQPSLNLDFANSKQLDPRITFVRNSTATYYDGQTTALAEQNLATYSQDFTNANWSKTFSSITGNTATAPDGTTTAGKFIPDNSSNRHSLSNSTYLYSISGLDLSFSIYAKAAEYNQLYIFNNTGVVDSYYVFFNLTTGAIGTNSSGGAVSNATITSVGNGWYRCSAYLTFIAGAGRTIGYGVSNADGVRSFAGDGTSGIYIWGAQLEQRSSVTAYTPTTTAAITNYIPQLMTAPANVARFDCDPITRNSLGLLIEESRTNLLTYSSDFSNAVWGKGNTTITSTSNIAPDGTQTASFNSSITSGQAYFRQYTTVLNATSYTQSIYAKANTATWLKVELGWAGFIYANFNLLSGTLGTLSAGVTATIISVGNGWYKCTATGTSTSTAGYSQFDLGIADNTFTNAVNQGAFFWGAQLEAGAFATSYIPTVASTVTRAADAASMTGTNFSSWYNQSEWSLYWESNSTVNTVTAIIWELNGNTGIAAFGANNINGGLARFVTYGSTTVNQIAGSIVAGSTNKYSVTTKPGSGNNVLTLNGVVQSTTASPAWLNVPTGLYLYDVNSGGTSGTLNGHIKKLSYYPVALSSSNLVALTS